MVSFEKKGFSLIEILITIAIIGILYTSFFYIWNSLEIFSKARDTKRINDLNLLNSAIQSILATQNNIYLGNENIIYISLPDSTSTCLNYSLVKINSPYSYQCKNQENFQNIDGSGWIPIDFKLSKIINITNLPIDPINNQDFFYAYITKNSKFKLTAKLESKQYSQKMINDGGIEPTLYEIGNNPRIPSPNSGLIGYWSFDEIGNIVYDLSGYQNNGTMFSGITTNDLHATSSCKIGYCSNFDGIDDYIKIDNNLNYDTNAFTILGWINSTDITSCQRTIISSKESVSSGFILAQPQEICNKLRILANINGNWQYAETTDTISTNTWYFVAGIYNGSLLKIYLNNKTNFTNFSGTLSNNSANTNIGSRNSSDMHFFKGKIDEIRIYNRALNDQEIKLIYEATK